MLHDMWPDYFVQKWISGPFMVWNIGWLDRQKKQGLLDSFGPSDDLAPEAAHSLGDEKGASIQVKQDKF